jgi:uncharacterized protein (TIGR03083 family)
MEKTEIWPVIRAERKALATDLGALGQDQWASPSLCGTWTVRDVLAHMTATAKLTPPAFFAKLAGVGFSFGRLQEKNIAAEHGASPADTLSRFEAELTLVKHPRAHDLNAECGQDFVAAELGDAPVEVAVGSVGGEGIAGGDRVRGLIGEQYLRLVTEFRGDACGELSGDRL